MDIQKVPDSYIKDPKTKQNLFVHDFKMTTEVVKSKIDLSMHMFSFLQIGRKQVHFTDTSIAVNKEQSLLIKKGNCLWTEVLETEGIYFCKLLFFSDLAIKSFLKKYSTLKTSNKEILPYFTIENDQFIESYLSSLTTISNLKKVNENLLQLKFEEILLYLISKHGNKFELFLHSLVSKELSSFQKTIESSIFSNLKLEEIAFLCNMSLSTFKRHFKKEYKENPGNWLQDKRLLKAKELIEKEGKKASNIYLDFGYNNLSNFSIAFKNKFGFNPSETPAI